MRAAVIGTGGIARIHATLIGQLGGQIVGVSSRTIEAATAFGMGMPYEDVALPRSFAESVYEGFSDHTIGIEAALVAVGRGARIIEKHFTLNKGLPGPDHICSATPDELAELSRLSRLMEKLR